MDYSESPIKRSITVFAKCANLSELVCIPDPAPARNLAAMTLLRVQVERAAGLATVAQSIAQKIIKFGNRVNLFGSFPDVVFHTTKLDDPSIIQDDI